MAFTTSWVSGGRSRRAASQVMAARLPIAVCVAGMLMATAIAVGPLKPVALAMTGTALIIAVFVRPEVGVVAIAASLPYGGMLTLPIAGANLVDLLIAITFIAWLARGLADRSIRLRSMTLAVPMLLFLWLAGLSLMGAVSWREGLPEWLKWIELLLVYGLAANLLRKHSSRWLLGALIVAAVSQAALGLWQFVGQAGPDPFAIMGRFSRAYGTFRQPNPFAGYLGYAVPVELGLTIAAVQQYGREKREKHARQGRAAQPGRADRQGRTLWLAAGLAAATAVTAGGIVASWSRGAWLGLAAGAGVVVLAFVLQNWRAAVLVLTATLVLVGAVAMFGLNWLPESIVARVSDIGSYVSLPDPSRTEITDANFSVLERLAHWQVGISMFEAHPWTGVGIGNYGVAYEAYSLPHWYEALGHAHNVYINFLAETGVLGLAGFLLLWLAVLVRAIRAAAQRGTWVGAVAIGILGVWVFVTVQNIFDNLFVQHMQLQLGLLVGLIEHPAEARS